MGRIMSMGNGGRKSAIETDFARGNRWSIELVRTTGSRLCFVLYETEGEKCTCGFSFGLPNESFVVPAEDELIRHVRFAHQIGDSDSVQSLLQQIDSFISRCLDLDSEYRFLLACFVLSTWLIDQLPIAPILAIVGLSQSGKTTALKILHLLCRRGIFTSDITSKAFYRMCDRLAPTVFIDNAADVGLERKLFHLLRSGTAPNIGGSLWSQSYRTYGPKVVAWTEFPDNEALNSRCIVIPMEETSRTDLLRPNDSNIVAAADSLQGRLLKYRLQKHSMLQVEQIPEAKHLRPRDRDLYEALALPIADDPGACVRLMECMLEQRELHRLSLPPKHAAVLETLFQLIHIHPELGTLSFSDLAKNVNLNLERAGEPFHLTGKGVGKALTSLGLFSTRNRISSGTVGCIDRSARKRIHDLVSRHEMYGLADCLSSEVSWELCNICKSRDARIPEVPSTGKSTNKLPAESAERNPSEPAQPRAKPEKDPAQSPVPPNSAEEHSFYQTDRIGSNRWFENEGDRDLRDRLNGDYDDDDL